jgi:hypothetical protein
MKELSNVKRIIAFVAVFLFLFVIAWFDWQGKNEDEKLIPISGSITEVVDSLENTKTITNQNSGIELKVDKDWISLGHSDEGIDLIKKGKNQIEDDTDLVDGIDLKVNFLAETIEGTVFEWLLENTNYNQDEINKMDKIEINDKEIFITEQIFEDDDYLPTGIKNVKYDYLVIKEGELFDFSCNIVAESSKIQGYKDDCLKVVLNNM